MAYTASVTIQKVQRIEPGGLGMVVATVDITSYNSTLVEITDITAYFESGGIEAVVANSISDNGYWQNWVAASSAFKCWKAAATQQDDNADHGSFDCVVYGYLKG